MDQSNFDQAETVLDSIVSIRPDAAAYLKLGMIYSKRKGKYRKAEMYYKKAMETKRHYAEAYYGLAMLYKEGPYLKQDAIDLLRWAIQYNRNLKDAYYQRALLLMQYKRAYSRGLSILQRLMLIDPEYKDCYTLYRRIIFGLHKFNRMSGFLPKLILKYPDVSEYRLDLILILHRARDYREARKQLELLKGSNINLSQALLQLYEARILFALNQDTLAHDLYFKGVDSILTEEEADNFFTDIIFLVTDDEYDTFMNPSVFMKKRCLKFFWKGRDPILVTPYNERLAEHFQRLRYARKHLRRFTDMEPLIYFQKNFRKPTERSIPTALTRYSETKGSKYQQEIDDCGLIYIRHGKPDKQETFLSRFSNTNLSWLYLERGDRPEMSFHFRYMRGAWSDGYRMEVQSAYRSERFIVTEGGPENIRLGTSTTTTNVKPPHGTFEFPFTHYCYKGENRLQDVYYHYNLPEEALPDRKASIPYGLRHEIILYNSNWEEINRFDTRDSVTSLNYDLNGRITRKIHQRIPSGIYFTGMRLSNEQTKKQGILKMLLNVPSTTIPGLKMTEIMLVDANVNETLIQLEEYEQSIAGLLVPNVERTFQKDTPIVVYFEVYNVRIGRRKKSDFSVNLQIKQIKSYSSFFSKLFSKIKNIFRKVDPSQISVEDDYSGDQTDEFILRSIVLPDYIPGEYELEISITDQIARTSILKKIDFKILD